MTATTLPQSLVDAAEATLTALDDLARELHRAGGRDSSDLAYVRRFCAYQLADLEGAGAGWLGSGFLRDAVEELLRDGRADASTGCADCGHDDDHIDQRDGCATCNDNAQEGAYAPCAATEVPA